MASPLPTSQPSLPPQTPADTLAVSNETFSATTTQQPAQTMPPPKPPPFPRKQSPPHPGLSQLPSTSRTASKAPAISPPSASKGTTSARARSISAAKDADLTDPSGTESILGGNSGSDRERKMDLEATSVQSATIDLVAGGEDRAVFEKLLEGKMSALTDELHVVEADIQSKEEEYITKTWPHGNVMRGWDGYVRRVDKVEKKGGTGSGTATGAPKYRKSKPSDRMFSLCSSTSKFRLENPDVLIQKKPPDKKKKKKR